MTKEEEQIKTLSIICQYLLFERKQETQLQMAFAILAQERHNRLHTKNHHKSDEDLFSDCSNDVCKMSYKTLMDGRQPAVEINEFTLKMIDGYTLKVQKTGSSCRVWLEGKPLVEEPKLVIP